MRQSFHGIRFAKWIFRTKTAGEVFMSWLIRYFNNRQVKKLMKARMKEWLLSKNSEEKFSFVAFPVKQ
jgi:hypothetical protein